MVATPKQDQQEQEALTALRQCSAALLRVFLDLDDEVVKRLHRATRAGPGKRSGGMLTPSLLMAVVGLLTGVLPVVILALSVAARP